MSTHHPPDPIGPVLALRGGAPGEAHLRTLISERAVCAAFQPIICHEEGVPVGYEGFTRPKPGFGFDNALSMFDAAERFGLQWELEDLARENLFANAAGLPAGRLFINVSPAVLADPRFVDRLEQQVARVPGGGGGGLGPSRLVIEITERAESGSVERLAVRVAELKSLGYQIAVDDVGAGVSGLNRLMLLRPHWLKLDRELTHRLDEDRYKQNLIHFLVHFANLSGVSLIAEGVERREELATLIASGIRHSQGYLLSRPSTSFESIDPELPAWLKHRWTLAAVSRGADPRRAELGTLCQPAVCVQARESVTHAAALLLRDAEARGVVVHDGRRFVGWCPRAAIIENARGTRSGMPIGLITPPGVATLSPAAALGDALSLVSVRSEEELAAPLVVSHEDNVVGIVPLRALVAAAAKGGRTLLQGMPITGLPGRAAADRFVTDLLNKASRDPALMGAFDAAFIDIRQVHRVNQTAGYDAGDRLIRALADLLRQSVVEAATQEGREVMLAHLVDDRFLAIAPSAVLSSALARVPEEFADFVHDSTVIGALPLMVSGLRILEVPGVLSRITGPRDLQRVEVQLRRKTQSADRQAEAGEAVRITDKRHPDRITGWKTA